jgi:hypothetical protein
MKKTRIVLIASSFLLASGLISAAGQAPPKLKPPERGFLSSAPGLTWEQGLLSGSG